MAQYRGTFSLTQNSPTVTVTAGDSLLTSDVNPSDILLVDNFAYVIQSVDSATQITLTVNYTRSTNSFTGAIHRDFTTFGVPLLVPGDIQTAAVFNRAMTLIVNAISGGGGGGFDAVSVTFDPSTSDLTSVNVQSAIVEAFNTLSDADGISFDPSGNSLSSTDVQAAIVEVLGAIVTAATGISFDSSGNDLTATDVQAAIAEVNGKFGARLLASNNLSDVGDAATARTNLGIDLTDNRHRAITISNSGPSGGADGDVWLQY